jgi:hypothetical protein
MKMRGRSPQGLRLFFFEDTMSGIPFYARRWVSGATMAEALQQVVTLNAKNISVTLDLLGENITSLEQAKSCTDEYVDMLDRIQEGKLSSHVSVKLTMLGLDINEDVCFENLKMILSKADKLGNRVALDMEGTPYTERTSCRPTCTERSRILSVFCARTAGCVFARVHTKKSPNTRCKRWTTSSKTIRSTRAVC